MRTCPKCKKSVRQRLSGAIGVAQPSRPWPPSRHPRYCPQQNRVRDYVVVTPLAVGDWVQLRWSRKTAQKFILKHLALDNAEQVIARRAMLEQECRTLASLHHRGLPEGVQYTVYDASLFLLFRFWEGNSLLGYIRMLKRLKGGKATLPDFVST